MADAQSFANHRRFFPLFHFVAGPILILNAIGWIVHFFRHQPYSAFSAFEAVVAIALIVFFFCTRVMAITLQDRLIRLEERLRLERVLPAEQRGRINDLTAKQLTALRFASDAELPGLVAKTLEGAFAGPEDIKRAITTWRPDTLRV